MAYKLDGKSVNDVLVDINSLLSKVAMISRDPKTSPFPDLSANERELLVFLREKTNQDAIIALIKAAAIVATQRRISEILKKYREDMLTKERAFISAGAGINPAVQDHFNALKQDDFKDEEIEKLNTAQLLAKLAGAINPGFEAAIFGATTPSADFEAEGEFREVPRVREKEKKEPPEEELMSARLRKQGRKVKPQESVEDIRQEGNFTNRYNILPATDAADIMVEKLNHLSDKAHQSEVNTRGAYGPAGVILNKSDIENGFINPQWKAKVVKKGAVTVIECDVKDSSNNDHRVLEVENFHTIHVQRAALRTTAPTEWGKNPVADAYAGVPSTIACMKDACRGTNRDIRFFYIDLKRAGSPIVLNSDEHAKALVEFAINALVAHTVPKFARETEALRVIQALASQAPGADKAHNLVIKQAQEFLKIYALIKPLDRDNSTAEAIFAVHEAFAKSAFYKSKKLGAAGDEEYPLPGHEAAKVVTDIKGRAPKPVLHSGGGGGGGGGKKLKPTTLTPEQEAEVIGLLKGKDPEKETKILDYMQAQGFTDADVIIGLVDNICKRDKLINPFAVKPHTPHTPPTGKKLDASGLEPKAGGAHDMTKYENMMIRMPAGAAKVAMARDGIAEDAQLVWFMQYFKGKGKSDAEIWGEIQTMGFEIEPNKDKIKAALTDTGVQGLVDAWKKPAPYKRTRT